LFLEVLCVHNRGGNDHRDRQHWEEAPHSWHATEILNSTVLAHLQPASYAQETCQMAPLRGFVMVNSASAARNISKEGDINFPSDMAYPPTGFTRNQERQPGARRP
jgi:hypothetical protein